MKEDAKIAFVEALLSGKFRQITGRLTDQTNGRCATGVLCDVAKEAGLPIVRSSSATDTRRGYFVFDNKDILSGSPNKPIATWADVDFDWVRDVQGLNDAGYTFEQIADLVKNDKVSEIAFEEAQKVADRIKAARNPRKV